MLTFKNISSRLVGWRVDEFRPFKSDLFFNASEVLRPLLPCPSWVEEVGECKSKDFSVRPPRPHLSGLCDSHQWGYSAPKVRITPNRIRISPPVNYDLSVLKSERNRRGGVSVFSRASKCRLEEKLTSYNVEWKSFLTLTFRVPYREKRSSDYGRGSGRWSAWKDWNICNCSGWCSEFGNEVYLEHNGRDLSLAYSMLKAFIRSVSGVFISKGKRPPLFVWKREFTSRGVVHFHLVSTAVMKPYVKFLQRKWAFFSRDVDNVNSLDVQTVKKKKSVTWYLAKYVSKMDKGFNPYCTSLPPLVVGRSGRWWGVFNARFWDSEKVVPVSYELEREEFEGLFERLTSAKALAACKSVNRYFSLTYYYTEELNSFLQKWLWEVLENRGSPPPDISFNFGLNEFSDCVMSGA